MQIAVISDIHANLEAFDAVLDDMDHQAVESVISLGDNINYGADSEAVIQKMINRKIFSVLGNHELACVNKKVYRWYKGDVKMALDHTLSLLSASSVRYLQQMTLFHSQHQAYFVHGFWPDSVRHYLHQMPDIELEKVLNQMKETRCFVGHTHRLSLVSGGAGDIHVAPLNAGVIQLSGTAKYIINAGSVGQPRNKDLRATYLIWDTKRDLLNVRYVDYDNDTAARKILSAGLPVKYAQVVSSTIQP
jgi:predicted phosphodiesterase